MEKATVIRVGIVEDDKRIQAALRTIVSGAADMLITSIHGNAEEAIAAIATDCPDVVIMDINLPGATGVDCVRELSQRCTGTQYLMYTMHDDDRFVFDALKSGANGYLLKSAKPGEILAAIRELMEGGSPMSAHVARRVVANLRPVQGNSVADANLTEREQQVLKLLAQGLLYKEISELVGISVGAIKQHIHRMYEKLHVQNRTEAVNRFFGR